MKWIQTKHQIKIIKTVKMFSVWPKYYYYLRDECGSSALVALTSDSSVKALL
jgi:hypothetical protein